MTAPRTPDDRLFPAKVAAALVTLLAMIGLFAVAVQRGPNDFYEYVVGAVTLTLAIGIITYLVRRHRRLRRTGPGPRT